VTLSRDLSDATHETIAFEIEVAEAPLTQRVVCF
jgi:hypothetical protein